MNLGFVDRSTVLHEFGHSLGLIHEHQSPFKGGFEWNKEEVRSTHFNYYTDQSSVSEPHLAYLSFTYYLSGSSKRLELLSDMQPLIIQLWYHQTLRFSLLLRNYIHVQKNVYV